MKAEELHVEERGGSALDLDARVRVGDVEGVASRSSRREAIRLIVGAREEESGTSERRVLRTGDARKLKRELLMIFAGEASSGLAKNCLLFLVPSLDRKLIQSRLERCAKAKEVFEALRRQGGLDKCRSSLARLSFAGGKPGEGSPTLDFFASRRELLTAVQGILADFPAARQLFEGIDPKVLHEVLGTIDEVGGTKIEDAEAIISDGEIVINGALRRGAISGREKVIQVVEEELDKIASTLGLNLDEERTLKNATFESLSSLPFEFDRVATRRLITDWRRRKEAELAERVEKAERKLRQYIPVVNEAIEKAVLLDQMLAVASVIEKYSLSIPGIGTGGIGFVNARNPFLVREQLGSDSSASLQPVSYSIGRVSPSIMLAKPRNAVILTGANSGGKTTLLNTLAAIHILALLGLPVPAESAEVTPMPIYLFRKRVARRIGSLEHVLRSTIPPLADRRRKLVLIDELEALTEPGAAGRIIAAIINRAATTSSLFLLVTHLAKETLPYVKLPVRVDGIEASGLNERGELAVDRQPRFDHIGSSTPKLIVLKLSKTAKDRAVKAIYDDVLASLEEETGAPVQAPIALPWVNEDEGG